MAVNKLNSRAHRLLLEYRTTLWRISALEVVPGVGCKALQAYKERILFVQSLVEILRNHKRLGDRLYSVIYAAYMTQWQPIDVDETLHIIEKTCGRISRRTYYRLRERAIEILDSHMEEIMKDECASYV